MLGHKKCSQRIGTVRLRYGVVPLPKKKEVDTQAPDHVFGQAGMTHARLNATADSFVFLFYGQKSSVTKNDGGARVFCGCEMTRH